MARAPALLAAALSFVPLPALSCTPERTEDVSELRSEAPLTLAAPDGRRFRILALAGEAAVPAAAVARIAVLGPVDRHERTPVLTLGRDGPVEADLLRRGLARLTPTRLVPRDCWRLLEAAETEAVTARRGIWATPQSLLDTNDVEGLKAADGRFVIATGRVRSVRTVNRITYVNFGPPRAGALTVTIHDRDMPAFREVGLEPAAFRGHMLRVRGVVTIRRGPFIAAAMPEAVTIAEAPVRGAR